MNVRKYSQTEFDEYGLPHNRKEVFFDVLKNRYGVIVCCGLIMCLFTLPYFAVKVLGETVFTSVFYKFDGDMTAAEDYAKVLRFYISLAHIPCFIIMALALAGVVKVIRQLIWAEALFFETDFFSGIKQNGLHYALTFALYGVIKSLDYLLLTVNVSTPFVLYLPTGVIIVFIVPLLMTALSQTAVYSVTYPRLISNSFKLYVKNIPVNLLFVIILIIGLLTDFITITLLKYAVIFIEILLLLTPYIMARMLFDFSVFDKYINARNYPELVDKGLIRLDKIGLTGGGKKVYQNENNE